MKNIKTNPLVSVIVVTYNSAKYVIETLESIKAQTYKNIELIITDDCSTDNTFSIVKNWLLHNNDRFVSTLIVSTPKNIGVAPNCNLGLSATKGDWVKLIAADDILLPRCVESNLIIASKYPNNELIFSRVINFDSDSGKDIAPQSVSEIKNNDGASQLRGLLRGHYIKAPGAFIKNSLIKKLGGFDTRYPMVEDGPFWIKANQAGYYFVGNPEFLVKYRIHSKSLSSNQQYFVNPIFYPSLKRYKQELAFPLLKRERMYRILIYLKVYFWICDRVMKKGNNIKAPKNLLERIFLKLVWIIR